MGFLSPEKFLPMAVLWQVNKIFLKILSFGIFKRDKHFPEFDS